MRTLLRPMLLASILAAAPAGPATACTNFCMDTPEGPIFGSNLDLFLPGDGFIFVNRRGIAKEGFQEGTTGEKARWVSEYGSITFNLAAREMAFGGMNEAGLVVGSMELRAGEFPERDERPGMTIGLWAQYVLDTCADIEDVAGVDSLVRIEDQAPPNHFLIADARGNCAAIEWMDGKLVCRVGKDVPVKAMSNMPYERALAAYERGGPHWWWSNPGRSAERFADAADRCAAYDAARNPRPVRYALGTLTRVVAAPHTKWNIVYDIPKREIWYRSVRSPAIKHLSFASFDLSCDAPELMLDVNADLAGDVSDRFVPYDPEANLALFRTICARFELGVPDETTASLAKLLEEFSCAD